MIVFLTLGAVCISCVIGLFISAIKDANEICESIREVSEKWKEL